MSGMWERKKVRGIWVDWVECLSKYDYIEDL